MANLSHSQASRLVGHSLAAIAQNKPDNRAGWR